MIEKNDDIYSNLKRKILPIKLQVEFNMIINFLKSIEPLRVFYLREKHGIAQTTHSKSNQFNENLESFFIFPKIKGENLEIKDFTDNNINSKKILTNHYLYKIKLLYKEGWECYRKVLFRFKFLNNINDNKKY